MEFTLREMDHVEVFVRDPQAAADWYERVLGLRIVHRWTPAPIMVGAGGTKLALFPMERPTHAERMTQDEPRRGWRRVAWATDENGFIAAREQLQRFGIVYEGPIDHGICESIYFTDPDGNALEITRYFESAA